MMRYLVFLVVSFLAVFSCSPKKATKDSSKNDTTVLDSIMDGDSSSASAPDTSKVDTSVATEWDPGEVSYIGEQAIVYKTKKDYSNNVPVKMNEEKTKIVAYPSPKDLFYKDKLAYPIPLKNGYLLDNRGVGKNSVFIEMSYEAYSKLDQAPLLNDMMKMIVDKDPFLEIYSLGTRSRFKDEIKEINEIIERGTLKKFKRIK